MVRKLFVVAALAILLPAAVSQAQFRQGDWELTLSGSGFNGPDFDGFAAGANASLGYFVADQLELSVRQTVNYNDIGVAGSDLNGSTRAAIDLHFDLGRIWPFIGANLGYVYGDAVNDTWEGAPEAGLKWFVNGSTFIFVMAEYQFFFDKNSSFGNALSDGQFVYTLGIGFRF